MLKLERTVAVSGAFTLAGILLGIGFLVPALWWLSLLGVLVFLRAVEAASPTRGAVMGGVLAWSVKSFLGISWFLTAGPFPWVSEASPFLVTLAVLFFTLYVSVVLGLAGGLLAFVVRRLMLVRAAVALWVAFPILWVGAEVLSSFLFSVFTYGPGGQLGISFTYGYLGYLLAAHGGAFWLSAYGGVYLLSALGALGGLGFFVFAKQQTRYQVVGGGVILGLLVVVGSASVLQPRELAPTEGRSAAVVTTSFTSDMLRSDEWLPYRETQLSEAVSAAMVLEPDYLVLPEGAHFGPTLASLTDLAAWYRLALGDIRTVVVDSRAVRIGRTEIAQRAVIYDGQNGEVFITDKQGLVPAGEFVPYATAWFLKLVSKEAAAAYAETLVYRPGPYDEQSRLPDELPAIMFCFESTDPLAARQLARDNTVPFIAHPISHALFTEPTSLWSQQRQMLRIQARFAGVPIVSASNQAASHLYLPDGRVVTPTAVAGGERWQLGLVQW